MRRSARAARHVPQGGQASHAHRRAPLLATVTAAGALVLSGCQLMSPVTTLNPYQAADGVSTTLGDVGISDLLVVSSAKDSPGIVSGRAVNTGGKEVTLSLAAPNAKPVTIAVPAHGSVRFSGGTGPDVDLSTVHATPGSLLTLSIGSPSHGINNIQVPVLLPQGPYATMTSTAAATPAG